MKKILLVAVNSKYIHSNLAVYCLKAAAGQYSDNVDIKEYTINNQTDDILRGIYECRPDVIGLSCYIWNITIIKELIVELAKVLPGVPIWLGGPEVSYNAEWYVANYDNVAGVMRGEGEEIFASLTACYEEDRIRDIELIQGITMNTPHGIINNPCPPPIDMSNMKMPYDVSDYNKDSYRNKIIYYESSRGCPFSCSYCLSSVDKRLRFRSTSMVLADLQFFIDNEVSLVKFVDRTFNCQKEHALTIWRYIKEHDRGITEFHFEIAADILDDEEIEVLNSMRPGLVQLEIGVQSTNPDTVKAIHRSMNIKKLADNVEKIRNGHNIHMHLDLIAGLPYENLESFGHSFDDIYAMRPDQLQLGFLKLLYGSLMKDEAQKYGIVGREQPPYEVLYTNWLSFGDIITLKLVENVVDMFYNSGMFGCSLSFLMDYVEAPFELYLELGRYYDRHYPQGSLPSRNGKYELLYAFAQELIKDKKAIGYFKDIIKYDMLKRDNVKALPDFLEFNAEKAARARSFSGDRKLTKAEHIEIFDIDVVLYENEHTISVKETAVWFDYGHRTPHDNNACIKILESL